MEPLARTKPGSAVFRQFADHMHDPGVVTFAGGWGFVAFPARVVGELAIGPPLFLVKGRVAI